LQRITTLERAFALAADGSCHSIADIRTRLKREQYDSVDAHLAGSVIQKQLKVRIASVSR
jgi:hypothetical protein